MTEPLPVTLIGGYLGAGKTTLVNQMLRQADGKRLAVLVNEFGELPIDEDLIEARDEDLISIAGGCICCSFGNDLMEALSKIAAFEPPPDHIVIEASGVALPGAIAGSVGLLDGLRMEGICVLVDALNIRSQARDEYIGDTIERQVSEADLLVVSKTDLVTTKALDDLRAWLAENWPGARVTAADKGHVLNSILLGHFAGTETSASTHADAAFDSVILPCPTPCDPLSLLDALTAADLHLVRVKGFVDALDGRRALVQLAGGETDLRYPDNPGPLGVICIGLKGRMDADAVRAAAARAWDRVESPT